jgi:hypothetical protein
MALVGKSTAVVSLGVSCQTTFQIERARPLLVDRLDEELEEIGLPFDWRIQGPADVAAILRENNPYPQRAAELGGDRNRYWEKRRTWFWHEKWEDFARFSEKQAHLWANWGRVGRTKRQVFVASNTQNNLVDKARDFGGFDFKVRLEDLFALQAQLETLFPAPELHFVTRGKLMVDLESFGFQVILEREHVVRVKRLAREGVHLHILEPDRSQWQGPAAAWDQILDRIIRQKAPRKVTTAA